MLTAGTAEEAIELFAQSQPDLILLDVVLPGMSGVDLCRQVRGGDGIKEPDGTQWPARTGEMLAAKTPLPRRHLIEGFPRRDGDPAVMGWLA